MTHTTFAFSILQPILKEAYKNFRVHKCEADHENSLLMKISIFTVSADAVTGAGAVLLLSLWPSSQEGQGKANSAYGIKARVRKKNGPSSKA